MANLTHPDPTSSRQRFLRMAPLVRAIARELRERSGALLLVEAAKNDQANCARSLAHKRLLEAEAALERRELERATRELEHLGCTIVAWAPLTVALERKGRKALWMLDEGV